MQLKRRAEAVTLDAKGVSLEVVSWRLGGGKFKRWAQAVTLDGKGGEATGGRVEGNKLKR